MQCSACTGCGGRGRGSNYTGSASAPKKGLCTALSANVFDYGTKGTADQMRTSWEKLVQYIGTNYGQDISNELQNKAVITLAEPTHSATVLARHVVHEMMIHTSQVNLQAARHMQLLLLQALVDSGVDPEAPMKLAVLQNEMAQVEFEAAVDVPIDLTNSEKTQWSNNWRTYHERNSQLSQEPRTGIFPDHGTVHTVAAGQDEAGCRLGGCWHVLQSSPIILVNRENGAGTNGRPVPICDRL